MAAIAAFDAFRTGALRRFFVCFLVTIVLSAGGLLALRTVPGPDQPLLTNKLQREFGPDWDCSSGAFCVRNTPKP